MKKLLKWGCLVTLTLVVVLGVTAWQQITRLRDNLEADTPLAIKVEKPNKSKVHRLSQRVEEAENQRVLRLNGSELTFIAQRLLHHPEAQRALEEARAQALRSLSQVPDPMGFLDGLRLDAVDLRHARADVKVAHGQITVRFTAPYSDGKAHLNIKTTLEGGWAPGAVRIQVRGLSVGAMDVLDLPVYGSLVHTQVNTGAANLSRLRSGGPIEDVRVEDDVVVVRLRRGGAAEIAKNTRKYLR